MDDNHLHHPLLPLSTSTATTTTTGDVASPALRLLLIISIGVISMWANHEASKGFVITIINDMKNTPVGDKFSLFYVSNDEITRLVEGASDFATKILYPNAVDTMPEMVINDVEVHFTNHNLTHGRVVVAEHHAQRNKYVLSISPSIMEYDDFRHRIRKEIQRCMTEIILLFNGGNSSPKALRDGMVEYVTNLAGFGGRKPVVKSTELSGKCWKDKNPKIVAQFLGYCEGKHEGFVGRLNQRMLRDGWDEEGMVDRANHLCESFRYSMMKNDGLIAMETISSYR